MAGIRTLLTLALVAALAFGEDESESVSGPSKGEQAKKALNKAFKGRITKIKKKRVTIYYDFEEQDQLQDFEDARPPRLLDASQSRFYIRGGRLVLEGSSAIRHKMEGEGELRAVFYVSFSRQWNVGAVITEPVLSDFYVVYTLFDQRFNRSGMMYIGACGLHEDEGADTDMALVNFRDIFGSNIKKKAKPGMWVEVEVAKDGWDKFFRVGDVSGSGSSRGKTKDMRKYQFGLFVHENSARFDDLMITFELTDEFLELNDLKAEIIEDYEEIPKTGPLAGIRGVPPTIRARIESFAAGGEGMRDVAKAMSKESLPKKAREVACQVLCEIRNPRCIPTVIDGLYSQDKLARQLSIKVVKAIVGKNFGYSATASEKNRSKALQKLNAYLAKNRRRYFG